MQLPEPVVRGLALIITRNLHFKQVNHLLYLCKHDINEKKTLEERNTSMNRG